MGAKGTAMAVQSADVVLLSDDFKRLPQVSQPTASHKDARTHAHGTADVTCF
jgi:cation transport ATPase